MKSNRELKALARQTLHGKFSGMISLFLAAYILESLIVSIPFSFLASPSNLPLYLSQILLTFLLETLGAMVMLGVNRGALKLVRGQKIGFQDLLFPFKNQCDHFLLLELIFTAINFITALPGYVFIWIYGEEMNYLSYYISSSLFTGLATVLTFLITLVFSMSEFLMLDDPSLTAKEALSYGMQLISGHVGQYFLLILSFVGFLLLGFTSLMIAFLWIIPYIIVSQALFYENLCDLQDEDYQTYE